jgi:hypothetical protein
MNSSTSEVRALLAALTIKIDETDHIFNEQTIGNACYGLKGMFANADEVLQLLAALTRRIRLSNVKFNAQAIGNISIYFNIYIYIYIVIYTKSRI